MRSVCVCVCLGGGWTWTLKARQEREEAGSSGTSCKVGSMLCVCVMQEELKVYSWSFAGRAQLPVWGHAAPHGVCNLYTDEPHDG